MTSSDIAGQHQTGSTGPAAPSLVRSPDVLLALALIAVVPVPGMLSGTAWLTILMLVTFGAALRRAAVARTTPGNPEPHDALRLMLASIVWMFALIAVTVSVASLAGVGMAIRVMILSALCHVSGTMTAAGTRIDRSQILNPFKVIRPEQELKS